MDLNAEFHKETGKKARFMETVTTIIMLNG